MANRTTVSEMERSMLFSSEFDKLTKLSNQELLDMIGKLQTRIDKFKHEVIQNESEIRSELVDKVETGGGNGAVPLESAQRAKEKARRGLC
jgi:hypothetical protein